MPGSPGVAARARVQCDFPAFIIQREPAQLLVRNKGWPPHLRTLPEHLIALDGSIGASIDSRL
jgi:hypothetical protein